MAAKKPPSQRVRKSTKDVGEVVPLHSLPPVASAASNLWSQTVAEQWHEFWSEPVASLVKASDLPALRRLFDMREKLMQCELAIALEPTVTGSMGQPVLSPWIAEQHRLLAAISKLEDQFGLTPLARLRLGVTFQEGASLAERNKRLVEEFRKAQEG